MLFVTKKRLATWAVNTFAVLVATNVVPGIDYGKSVTTLILASLVLGILNTLLKPVLMLFALPLLFVTAGLFYFFINAMLLYLVGFFVPTFHVDSFLSALFGGLVISFVAMVTNFILGRHGIVFRHPSEDDDDDDKNSDEVRPRKPRRIKNDDDDDSVIDV